MDNNNEPYNVDNSKNNHIYKNCLHILNTPSRVVYYRLKIFSLGIKKNSIFIYR